MPPTRALILSDIHLGPDAQRAPCKDPRPLARLLEHLADDRHLPPTELVLAGDTFDFLTSPGYCGLDPARAPEQMQAILHHNAPVVSALKRFVHARGRGHRLTLLAGNHDPEVLLPNVRGSLERALELPGDILYADDQPLFPRVEGRWPIWGRQLGSADAPLWVVHGDRWDPGNAFDRDAVRAAARGTPLALPPGSQLVYQVLTPLKLGEGGARPRPWIEQLKPEVKAVLPLLLYLEPQRTWQWIQRHSTLTLSLIGDNVRFINRVKRRHLYTADGNRSDAAPSEDNAADPTPTRTLESILAETLIESLAPVPEQSTDWTLSAMLEAFEYGSPPRNTLADHHGPLRWLARAWFRRVQQQQDFLALDGQDDIPSAIRPRLPEGLSGLVAGHTHGPRWWPDHRPAYLNSGTWIPVGRIPPGEMEAQIDRLDAGLEWIVETPRTLVEASWERGTPEMRLLTCDQGGNLRSRTPPCKTK